MTLRPVETDAAPAAIGPYSQAMTGGNLLFVSGQLGMDPKTGEMIAPDLEGQARQALTNLTAIVSAAGCAVDRIVAVDVFLTEIKDFDAFNRIYSETFSAHKPARAVVAVKALPKNALVEVKCVVLRA